MNLSTTFLSILIGIFLIACGGDDNGGNGNRRAGLIDTSGVRQFGVGQDHACAVLKTGKVSCWGLNLYGQLGDGTTIDQNIPVEVDLEEGRTARVVSAGGTYSCAILDNGSLVCWGRNAEGQLGVGDNMLRQSPAIVNLGENRTAVAITLGNNHSCAILDDDSLACWGANNDRQLGQGDSDTTNRLVPTEVNLGSGKKAVAVSAGLQHTCAIIVNGSVVCWGNNVVGQLGDGSTQIRGTPTPVDLGDGRTAKAIRVGGSHTCALLDNNTVKCWGLNGVGQLGDGTTTRKTIPTVVDLGEGRTAIQIETGAEHTCVLLDDNSVKCWGRNDFGQLGDETTLHKNTSTAVDTGTGTIAAIGAGGDSSCALFDDGSLACWGSNSAGQLGTGEETFVVSPQTLDTGEETITAIDGGVDHACAQISGSAYLRCWGKGESGELGTDTITKSLSYVRVLVGSGSPFSVGSNHACAIFSTNNAFGCWGENGSGQLGSGDNADQFDPDVVNLGNNQTAIAVSAGVNHTCAILNDGKVNCWGEGSKGQLGNGATNDSTSPVAVTMPSNTANKIGAGFEHTCAILDDEKVYCWGEGSSGQLGRGSSTDSNVPVAVTLDSARTATDIRVGSSHSCALLDDKSVVCWGGNTWGQLGDRSTIVRNTPVTVPLGSGRSATAIHVKGSKTCAILDDGSLLCSGRNDYGQLGDGTTVHTISVGPVAVDLGEGRTATAVGGGPNHTCAILDDESVKCWGDNYYGQAGVPTSHRGDQAGEMGENLKFVKFEKEKEKPLPEITLALGLRHTCAIDEEGGLSCWGGNDYNQLGVGADGNQICVGAFFTYTEPYCIKTPVAVDLGTGKSATTVETKHLHACAILNDGSLVCWGLNVSGQLGIGNNSLKEDTPVQVNGVQGRVTAVSTGLNHTCAIEEGGTLKCWGDNAYGQLGLGDTAPRLVPTEVTLPSGRSAVAVDTGEDYTCAIIDDGSLMCWGSNIDDRLGRITSTTCLVEGIGRNCGKTPGKVDLGQNTAMAISLGSAHTCAILDDGSLKCWGHNTYGQLGKGDTLATLNPTGVNLGTNRSAVAVSAGAYFTCAILDDGSLKCWGRNNYGQLGQGNTTDLNTPPVAVALPGGQDAKAVYAGEEYACAVLVDNSVACWGANHAGQLNDGTTIDRYRPARMRLE